MSKKVFVLTAVLLAVIFYAGFAIAGDNCEFDKNCSETKTGSNPPVTYLRIYDFWRSPINEKDCSISIEYGMQKISSCAASGDWDGDFSRDTGGSKKITVECNKKILDFTLSCEGAGGAAKKSRKFDATHWYIKRHAKEQRMGGICYATDDCLQGLNCLLAPGRDPRSTWKQCLCPNGTSSGCNYTEPSDPGAGAGDIFCPQDVKRCPDGSYVARDPKNKCVFPACSGTNNENNNQSTQISTPNIIQTPTITPNPTIRPQNQSKCEDSDGGKDYDEKGTVKYGKYSYSDKCSKNNKKVYEYYCNPVNGKPKVELHKCEYRCSNGACKKSAFSSWFGSMVSGAINNFKNITK